MVVVIVVVIVVVGVVAVVCHQASMRTTTTTDQRYKFLLSSSLGLIAAVLTVGNVEAKSLLRCGDEPPSDRKLRAKTRNYPVSSDSSGQPLQD